MSQERASGRRNSGLVFEEGDVPSFYASFVSAAAAASEEEDEIEQRESEERDNEHRYDDLFTKVKHVRSPPSATMTSGAYERLIGIGGSSSSGSSRSSSSWTMSATPSTKTATTDSNTNIFPHHSRAPRQLFTVPAPPATTQPQRQPIGFEGRDFDPTLHGFTKIRPAMNPPSYKETFTSPDFYKEGSIPCVNPFKEMPPLSGGSRGGDEFQFTRAGSTPPGQGQGQGQSQGEQNGQGQGKKQGGHKRKRGKTGKTSPTPSSGTYVYASHFKEDHGKEIYSCQFLHKSPTTDSNEMPDLFATVGSKRVSIYYCLPEGDIKLVQVYEDPDETEIYYTCSWSYESLKKGSKPVLAAGGARGIIRIFSPSERNCIQDLVGHTGSINHLIFHPKCPNLLFSASKDHSIRLWNTTTNFLVALFGGIDGHRDEVICADVDYETGTRLVTCGMDHSLKVWKLDSYEVKTAIFDSAKYNENHPRRHKYKTLRLDFPHFSTRDIHTNYVDCAKWFGDFIFSKSTQNKIVVWKAGKSLQKWETVKSTTTETDIVATLPLEDCQNWFVKFSFSPDDRLLALGNSYGQIWLYDLNVQNPEELPDPVLLIHPKCRGIIRQTAFSKDGSILICCVADGTVWRWNVRKDDIPEV